MVAAARVRLRPRRRLALRTLGVGALVALAAGLASAAAVPPCTEPGAGWCLARRFPGSIAGGELGFRFGTPRDVDGDGHADVAAGARFRREDHQEVGQVGVWSGATGALVRAWNGDASVVLLGHSVLPMPDADGDGLADVVMAAPHSVVDGTPRGLLIARSPRTGKEIWRRAGPRDGSLGWDLALTGDHNADGHPDLFAGQPGMDYGGARFFGGQVHLVSGKDGAILRTFAPPRPLLMFGWYVARVSDLDGDARDDLVVGAPAGYSPRDGLAGGAFVLSTATGKTLHHWAPPDAASSFGEVVAGAGDQDGDGRPEILVAAPALSDRSRTQPGEVHVLSSASGEPLRRWSGQQPGELFGRMVAGVGDVDGDGVEDVAIGAPWHRRGEERFVGRIELRSGASGAVLHDLVGDTAASWFGWHIRRAPDPEGQGRPALLLGSLRHPVDGRPGVGVLDLLVLRGRTPAPGAQGIMKRGVRRKDIR